MGKNIYLILFCITILFLNSCETTKVAKTVGETQSFLEYGYTPLDPLPVRIETNGDLSSERILRSLPDETVRIATGQVIGSGDVSYGQINVGAEGNSYIIIVDYIKSNVRSMDYPIIDEIMKTEDIKNVQVYYGVGLRVIANISVISGKINISNLYGLAAAAEAKQISGTMTIQTLGISGPSITPLLPIPSEISANSIQNALIAIGSIKAKMYDSTTNITIIPRVVAIYNNIGGGQKVKNNLISYLLKNPTAYDLDKFEETGASR